jgi:hypothetical protein
MIFYLNKVVVLINRRFLENVYKTRKMRENLVICGELERCLIDLGKIDESKPNTSYTNFVKKAFKKTNNTIKILDLPTNIIDECNLQKFYDSYKHFLEDMQLNEIQ